MKTAKQLIEEKVNEIFYKGDPLGYKVAWKELHKADPLIGSAIGIMRKMGEIELMNELKEITDRTLKVKMKLEKFF